MFFMSCFFFFKQKTAYEMRISDWSSDVCSSDLRQMLSECGCHTVDVAQFACLLDGRRNRRRRWCDRQHRLARQAENPQRPARDLTAVVEIGLDVRRRFSTTQHARDDTQQIGRAHV